MLRKIKKITENKKFNFILNVLLLILLIMIIFINQNNESKDVRKITREQSENYVLTNPILDCEDVNQMENPNLSYSDLRRKISEIKETYNIQEISVYYRDLNNGPWVGIKEEEKFSPASLLKIPVAMAFMKYAEDNPEILNKKVYVEKEDILTNYKQNLKFDGLLEINKEYTLIEVLESMLIKSDNSAVHVISRNIPEKYIDDVFHAIGVPYKDAREEVEISVKDYATFFRVLFNSSYLNRQMSEKLLEILSRTEYKNGLVAGVKDKDITISHKFGERVTEDSFQLHDCGIVYYPESPYLVCIMTKGNAFYKQQVAIQMLSEFIYSEVSENKS